MNELERAKKIYNSIEIPQELETVVKDAVENSKKTTPIKIHIMRFAPIAACAVICFVIGMSYLPERIAGDNGIETASFDEEAVKPFARIMPEKGSGADEAVKENHSFAMDAAMPEASAKSAYNYAVQAKIDESIWLTTSLDCVLKATGEFNELYADENVISYSVKTKPSGIENYFNISAKDGSDIKLETLIDNANGYNGFYFKDEDTIVVFAPTGEIEIAINNESKD